MSFSIRIYPHQTREVYGVNSLYGYEIDSERKINPEETEKIQKILGSFVERAIARDNMVLREEKFQNYVVWQPKEKWETIQEYRYYRTATERLNKAENNLSNIETQYQVTSITPFSNS